MGHIDSMRFPEDAMPAPVYRSSLVALWCAFLCLPACRDDGKGSSAPAPREDPETSPAPPPAQPDPQAPAADPEFQALVRAWQACDEKGEIYDVTKSDCRPEAPQPASWNGILYAEPEVLAYSKKSLKRDGGQDFIAYSLDERLYEHATKTDIRLSEGSALTIQSEACESVEQSVAAYRTWNAEVSMSEPKPGHNGRLDYVVFDWGEAPDSAKDRRVYVFEKHPESGRCAIVTIYSVLNDIGPETVFDDVIPTIAYDSQAGG
jgi:hypothetical protein